MAEKYPNTPPSRVEATHSREAYPYTPLNPAEVTYLATHHTPRAAFIDCLATLQGLLAPFGTRPLPWAFEDMDDAKAKLAKSLHEMQGASNPGDSETIGIISENVRSNQHVAVVLYMECVSRGSTTTGYLPWISTVDYYLAALTLEYIRILRTVQDSMQARSDRALPATQRIIDDATREVRAERRAKAKAGKA